MPGTILVAYGTKHGSTREVAQAVAETLEEHGLEVETSPAARIDDVKPYAGVVIGGAIYMGRWHPDAVQVPGPAPQGAPGGARRGVRHGPPDDGGP